MTPTLGGRYRLERRLASGGMAETYRALDLRLDRPVAVKMLHPYLASDPSFVERLRREARTVAALNHANVVKAYDHGVDGGRPFLVMELVDGESLAGLLRRNTPEGRPVALPIEQALGIVRDVLAALEHAHARGLVHRDVKPANVLLTTTGAAKLADFGIAQMLDGEALPSITQTGEVLGSLPYLAPERLAGQPATPAADVYAAGATLFQMLTGRLPFDGDSSAVVAAQHWQGALRPPSAFRPDAPAWLDQIVLRAMARDLAARYPTAQAMLRALERGPDASAAGGVSADATTAVLPVAPPAVRGQSAPDAPTRLFAPKDRDTLTAVVASAPRARTGHPGGAPRPRRPDRLRRLRRPTAIACALVATFTAAQALVATMPAALGPVLSSWSSGSNAPNRPPAASAAAVVEPTAISTPVSTPAPTPTVVPTVVPTAAPTTTPAPARDARGASAQPARPGQPVYPFRDDGRDGRDGRAGRGGRGERDDRDEREDRLKDVIKELAKVESARAKEDARREVDRLRRRIAEMAQKGEIDRRIADQVPLQLTRAGL